ncbi:MAG: ABC-F family ATP-binding cassette domain-containing protein [Anaerolineaceae bacterium]|nr:ABC-F family ATP-binding cassette domain-containing protein [Anaerolineaceae bacterium]
MLSVNQISKNYGIQTILTDVSFTVNAAERVGLVGPNGCGKTTLLRILVGDERPDTGKVLFNPAGLQLGYLPQGLQPGEDETIGSYLGSLQGDSEALAGQLEQQAEALVSSPDDSRLHLAYDRTLQRYENALESTRRAPEVLASLGLEEYSPATPVRILSGGQKTRLALAGVLLSGPQLLLLDEPTNHLDIAMLEWLEDWLATFRGGILVVSHDRAFLDRVATTILELDAASHTTRAYPGNYTAYLEQKVAEREKQWQAYSDQQDEIEDLKHAAAQVRSLARPHKGGKADSGDKFARGFFINRSLGTIRRAKNLEQRLEKLTGEEKLDKPGRQWQMKIEFGEVAPSGRDVLTLENLSAGYPGKTLLSSVDLVLRSGARAALVGPNGAGKTTLLRTIAGQLPPLAGRVRLGAGVRPGWIAQEQEDLDPASTPLETIQRELAGGETEARAFLHKFLFSSDEVFTPVGKLSYGERARLSLARLVGLGCNLLLLDEPINHLDIPARARFEQALAAYEGTVLAVVHDRYFIAGFASEIWEVSGQGIQREEKRDPAG